MLAADAPIPPVDLAARVGPGASEDPIEAYLSEGRAVRERIERMLPDGWDWTGKRVLDFGCGSGRVLRHFLPEADRAELSGCDIHAESIAWLDQNLPQVRAFANGYEPPLEVADGSFDLVYATSVFTHIGDHWATWLLEMHRVLAPGGLLVTSWLGEAMWEALLKEDHDEDAVGMTVRHGHTAADAWVFHSEWWLREHWGRAFEVLDVWRPPAGEVTHGYVSLRRREVEVTVAELERRDPAEPRELAALATNERILTQENRELAAFVGALATPDTRTALRAALRASPLAGPARTLRSRLGRNSA